MPSAISMPSATPKKAQAYPQEKKNQKVSNDSLLSPAIIKQAVEFANFSLPFTEEKPSFPTEPLVIVHLKLLQAFSALQNQISFTDGVFGIWDPRASAINLESTADVQDPTSKQSNVLAAIREKRWALFVARATERFSMYWTRVLCQPENRRLTQEDMMQKSFEQFTDLGRPNSWTTDMLPPLGQYHAKHSQPILTSCRCLDGLALIHAQP